MALPKEKLSERLELRLRRPREFEQELAAMRLPSDETELFKMLLAQREQGILSKYNTIFLLHQLERKGGNYWTKFGCDSFEEMLARFDLSVDSTLRKWSAIVAVFPKQTIVTLGEDSLYLMLRTVAEFQPDDELQREDFDNILTDYSRKHDGFDKRKFEDSVYYYVNMKYRKPQGVQLANNLERPPTPKGTHRKLLAMSAEAPSGRSNSPLFESRFAVETSACSRCKTWKEYAERLEQIITSELGAKRLPPRPN